MISEKYGVAPGDFLSLTPDELSRGRERIGKDQFTDQKESFLKKIEKLTSEEREMPSCDYSWYDENPDRPFSETYNLWHDYNRPVRKLTADACQLLRGGVLFERNDHLNTAREWLMYVVRNHGFHVDHYDSGMEFASTGANIAEGYSVLYERLSEEEKELFISQLTACGEAVMRCQKIWLTELKSMAFSNHLAIQNSGLLRIGLVLEREDWVENVLNGPKSFGRMLVGATMDNGLCYESSTRYHYATFGGLYNTARTARCCSALGRDLFFETYENGRTLKDMFDAPITLLFPNGELPQIGDAYAVTYPPLWESHKAMYETAYDIYGDPQYIWFLKQNKNWKPSIFSGPESLDRETTPMKCGTRQWPEHGFALISSDSSTDYWSGKGYTAFITGDRSGIHNHRDTLSLQLFAKNRLWTVDALSRPCIGHGFSSPIQKAFNRKTFAHNTVLVDQRDQESVRESLPAVMSSEHEESTSITMSDTSGQCYPGVRMQRHTGVTEEYCIDVFEVESDDERLCDWIVHLRGDHPAETGLDWKDASLPDEEPYSVLSTIVNTRIGKKGARISWKQNEDTMILDITAGTEAELFRCTYPQAEVDAETEGEMFMFRVRGKSVMFTALYQIQSNREWKITSNEKTFSGETSEINLKLENGQKTEQFIFSGLTPD